MSTTREMITQTEAEFSTAQHLLNVAQTARAAVCGGARHEYEACAFCKREAEATWRVDALRASLETLRARLAAEAASPPPAPSPLVPPPLSDIAANLTDDAPQGQGGSEG